MAETKVERVRRMVVAGATREEVFDAIGRDASARELVARETNDPERHFRSWRESQRRAGIWHLVDLKRAGHSPKHTELRIEPDRLAPHRSIPVREVFSSAGSQFDVIF